MFLKNLFNFPLDIQMFAENANEDTGAEDNNQDTNADKNSKGFTQADIDAAVAKEKAKLKARYDKHIKDLTSDDDKDQTSAKESEHVETVPNPYMEKYVQAELKVLLAKNGIDATKVDRAVRLIDVKGVLTSDGDVDLTKANTAIADLIKDWPELKPTNGDDKPGFKIGSNGNDNKDKKNEPVTFTDAIKKNIASQFEKAK